MTTPTYRAPADCPVCGGELVTTRVGCRSCGSELAGEFAHCDFCALDERDTELLRVFLASRGNLREVEKHLGVSYPTARARFTQLLTRLGLAGADTAPVTMCTFTSRRTALMPSGSRTSSWPSTMNSCGMVCRIC